MRPFVVDVAFRGAPLIDARNSHFELLHAQQGLDLALQCLNLPDQNIVLGASDQEGEKLLKRAADGLPLVVSLLPGWFGLGLD